MRSPPLQGSLLSDGLQQVSAPRHEANFSTVARKIEGHRAAHSPAGAGYNRDLILQETHTLVFRPPRWYRFETKSFHLFSCCRSRDRNDGALMAHFPRPWRYKRG